MGVLSKKVESLADIENSIGVTGEPDYGVHIIEPQYELSASSFIQGFTLADTLSLEGVKLASHRTGSATFAEIGSDESSYKGLVRVQYGPVDRLSVIEAEADASGFYMEDVARSIFRFLRHSGNSLKEDEYIGFTMDSLLRQKGVVSALQSQ